MSDNIQKWLPICDLTELHPLYARQVRTRISGEAVYKIWPVGLPEPDCSIEWGNAALRLVGYRPENESDCDDDA